MPGQHSVDGAYYELPQNEVCAVRGPGCLVVPAGQYTCPTEGSSYLACTACRTSWTQTVLNGSAKLALRCPRCASHNYGQPTVPAPQRAAEPVLSGPAGEAIEHALWAEGILRDQSDRVLRRLAREAPWLARELTKEDYTAIIEADLAEMPRP
jgi:hypothetical protein